MPARRSPIRPFTVVTVLTMFLAPHVGARPVLDAPAVAASAPDIAEGAAPARTLRRVLYTFRDPTGPRRTAPGPQGGGIAQVSIDPVARLVRDHAILVAAPSLRSVEKLALSDCGHFAIAVCAQDGPGNGVIIRLDGVSPPHWLHLPGEPDEVRTWRDAAFIGCSDGSIVKVALASGAILQHWNARTALDPPGHRPEDLVILEDRGLLLATFQKDHRSGARLGNRIVLLTLRDLALHADLPLPRTRPELHHPRAAQERGPGPEVALVLPGADRLVISLDLYGAMAVADLSTVDTRAWQGLGYIPTAPDDAFGSSFPDRFIALEGGPRPLVVGFHAGSAGGAFAVDPVLRRIAWHVEVPHGLSSPVLLRAARAVIAASAGKRKSRSDTGIERTFHPRPELWILRFDAALDQAPDVECIVRARNTLLAVVADDTAGLLLLAEGDTTEPTHVALWSYHERAALAEFPAMGEVRRMICGTPCRNRT